MSSTIKINPSTSNKAVENKSEARRAELLQIARRSRVRWILDAKDVSLEAESSRKVVEKRATSLLSDSVKSTIPAAPCIQKVLSYLTAVVDDGEECDVESVAAGIIDYDDIDSSYLNITSHTGYAPLSCNDIAAAVSAADTTADTTTTTAVTAALQGDRVEAKPHGPFNANEVDTYNAFIDKLLHPAAADVVKAMQQFVTKFFTNVHESRLRRTLKQEEDEFKNWSSNIWEFLDHLHSVLISSKQCHVLWNQEQMTAEQITATKAHFERFVFKKLHPVLFASDVDDAYLNEQTAERIASLSFLTAEHLDIRSLRVLHQRFLIQQKQQQQQQQQKSDQWNKLPPPQLTAATITTTATGAQYETQDSSSEVFFLNKVLAPAVSALSSLSEAHCPQDKLSCLRKCSMAIAQLLKECRVDGSLPGADELLPMMILALKTANPPALHSNLKYLQRYTRPSLLVSEAGYLLTNFVSAVYFLDNVDAKALTIEPDEFDRAVRQSKARAKEEAAAAASKSATSAAAVGCGRGSSTAGKFSSFGGRFSSNKMRSRSGSAVADDISYIGDSDEALDDLDVDRLLLDYRKELQRNNKTDFVNARSIHVQRKQQQLR